MILLFVLALLEGCLTVNEEKAEQLVRVGDAE